MALDTVKDLLERIEKFAPGNKDKRDDLFADLADRIRRLELPPDQTDPVLRNVLGAINVTLLQTAHHEATAKGAPKYNRDLRTLKQRIAWLSDHWLVRPFPDELLTNNIRSLHEAFCPHARDTRACNEIWTKLSQYQSRAGSRRALAEAKTFLVSESVDPNTADTRDFCPPDPVSVPLPPLQPKKGRARDLARDSLIELLVGLEARSGLLTAAGVSIKDSLDFVRRILASCFNWLVLQNSLVKHRKRLRQRAQRRVERWPVVRTPKTRKQPKGDNGAP